LPDEEPLVHLAHAAGAQLGEDFVLPDLHGDEC
jgi:hypothetical protein